MNNGETEDLCRRMNHVRHHLDQDVEGIVDSARTLLDWRHYLRRYPWACLAGAAAIGFFVVPKRIEIVRPDTEMLEELAKRKRLVFATNPSPHPRGGLGAAMVRLLAGIAVRSAATYLSQNSGRIFNTEGDRNARSHD